MAQVNIRIDDNLKSRADDLFSRMGMNMSTAVNIFVKQAVREQAIPFKISAQADPFYSEENLRILRQAIADADAGKLVSHDLIEV